MIRKKHKIAILLSIIIHFLVIVCIFGRNSEDNNLPDNVITKHGIFKLLPLSSIYLHDKSPVTEKEKIQKSNKVPVKDKTPAKKVEKNPRIVPEIKETEDSNITSNSANGKLEAVIDSTKKDSEEDGSEVAGDFSRTKQFGDLPSESREQPSSDIEIIDEIKPEYPYFAEKRGHEGKVLLRVEVLPSGKSGRIEIVESSGYRELDQAAKNVIPKWKFKPKVTNGEPSVGEKLMTITFKIES